MSGYSRLKIIPGSDLDKLLRAKGKKVKSVSIDKSKKKAKAQEPVVLLPKPVALPKPKPKAKPKAKSKKPTFEEFYLDLVNEGFDEAYMSETSDEKSYDKARKEARKDARKLYKEKFGESKPKPKKQTINFDKVESSSSFLSGVDLIYDFEEFMTDREAAGGSEAFQMRALEKGSARMAKFIMKRLKQIAKENKIKSTEEYIDFLKKYNTSQKMRDLMDL